MRIDRLSGVRVLLSLAAFAILASASCSTRAEVPISSSTHTAGAVTPDFITDVPARPDGQSFDSAFRPNASPSNSGTFTISATPPTPYITGAGATTYQVTLTSVGSFADQINLSCSGLPADATCTFTDNPTLTAGGTVTTTMTVTTTVADAKLQQPSTFTFHPVDISPIALGAAFPLEFTWLSVFFADRRRKSPSTQKVRIGAVLVFTFGLLGLTGCGCPPTVFHTYTINITGTSINLLAPAQSTSVLLSVGNQ
jgi:hypothetical protein